MKKYHLTALAALVLLATPLSRAWTYSDGDALLIFRESGVNDVEFDIGNVSQFTNLPAGTTITVPNWNANLVTTTFGADLTGVSVIVAATTSQFAANKASWLSGQDTSTVVTENGTPSDWQTKFWSSINAIGTKPVLNTAAAASTNAYSIDPSSLYTQGASYDYIVTGSGQRLSQIALFGGNASFNVEGLAPSSFAFWRIAPRTSAQYTGTFTITAAGVLTYTAGPLTAVTPPTILGVTRTGNVSTVSFTTIGSGNYWLTYTNTLGGTATNWPVVSGPIAGDTSNHILTHTNTGVTGFYRVYRTP